MIDGKRVLALIPARGGSKGLPRKNVLPLAGHPLIAWSVGAARACASIDRVILSSDDPEIIAAAREAGCDVPFVRPSELAADDTPAMDVVRHAVAWAQAESETYDYLVLLQPTSPLRTAEDIEAGLRLCHESGASTVVSVVEASKSPYWMYHLDESARLSPVLPRRADAFRRQNLPPAYALNGAVYVARWSALSSLDSFVTEDTLAAVMPAERSIDIDSRLDMVIAEAVLREIGGGSLLPVT